MSGFLHLKAGGGAWDEPVYRRSGGKGNADVEAAIGGGLIAAPGHGRSGQATAAQFRFAKKSDKGPKVLVAQKSDVVTGDFKHAKT
ncbi:hypothetical protein NKH58_28755 [Mesorhizobium australicum]|uniref:hypothetical protein n=1 Tax=Mesorhizobium australicum TaxID=536018 RepID=UPI0033352915